MIEFYVDKKELERALDCLKQLEQRGFPASQAVFGLKTTEDAEFRDRLIMKAHPTNPFQNWGRISKEMISWNRFVDGKIIDTYGEDDGQ
jgi:hypothetical protein